MTGITNDENATLYNDENATLLDDSFDDLFAAVVTGDDDDTLFDDLYDDALGDDEDTIFDDIYDDVLLDEDLEGAPSSAIEEAKLKSIYDSLVFMRWLNNCLSCSWISVPETEEEDRLGMNLLKEDKLLKFFKEIKRKAKAEGGEGNIKYYLQQVIRVVIIAYKAQGATYEAKARIDYYEEIIRYLDSPECGDIISIRDVRPVNYRGEYNPQFDAYIQQALDFWDIGKDKKIPTQASVIKEAYLESLDKECEIINDALLMPNTTEPQSILENEKLKKFVMPASIKFVNGKCLVKCSCSENHNDEHVIDATDLITFNIIKVETADKASQALLKLLNDCKDDELRQWLEELKNPSAVFNPLHGSCEEMLKKLDNARNRIPNTYTRYNMYIRTSYGSACNFSTNVVCSDCGRRIILPPKLLRYLICWHVSYGGEDVYRQCKDNHISPGFIKYRDFRLTEVMSSYRSAVMAAEKDLIDANLKTISEADGVDDLTLEKLRRNSLETLEATAGPVVDSSSEMIIAPRSIEEAYKRVVSRREKHTLAISRHYEDNLKPIASPKKFKSVSINNLPTDYWRAYNTADDDNLMAALMCTVDSLHLPFDTSPKYVLSTIFRDSRAKMARDTIIAQALYTRIICNFDIYTQYLNHNSVECTDEIHPVESTHSTWHLDETDRFKIVAEIATNLKKYSELTGMFTEEELASIDDPSQVTYDMMQTFIQTMEKSHSSTYENLRKPEGFTPPKVVKTSDIDTEIIQYITDELPWRYWYKYTLVDIIEHHSPDILATLHEKGTPGSRVRKGAEMLRDAILASATSGDTSTGEVFWRKIPNTLRGKSSVVLNKNLQEVSLLYAVTPVTITSNVLALLLQSDSADNSKKLVCNYISGDVYYNEIMADAGEGEEFPSDAQIAAKEPEKAWEDAIEWVLEYTPEKFTYALPKYIQNLGEVI